MSPFHLNKVSFIYPLQILLLEISLIEILLLDKLLLEIQLQETEGLKKWFRSLEKMQKYYFTERNWEELRGIERNWVSATNSDFLVPISLQSNVIDLKYFKLWILLYQIIFSLEYKWFKPLGCKDIGIRKCN